MCELIEYTYPLSVECCLVVEDKKSVPVHEHFYGIFSGLQSAHS